MEPVIWSQGLSRRFDGSHGVEGLDLEIRAGLITAFLGPNGAGKTTTICLLLGLLRADAGNCRVLGLPPGHRDALARIGALVERPALYDHLTGRENLEITRLMRDLPSSELDRVLHEVDLAAEAARPVHTYSLGMRQRLGVALALLGAPQLLILDEPANGLDPVGIQDMRNLVRRLARETGVSVFLSSHLLSEVEQLADDLVVIHRGRLRYQGTLEGFGTGVQTELGIRIQERERARAILREHGLPFREEGDRLWVTADSLDAPRIAELVVAGDCGLLELVPRRANLEHRFLTLLGES